MTPSRSALATRRARRAVYIRVPPMTARHRELQRYVRFGPDDSARVVASAAYLAPHLPRVSDVFYERIREHDDAHAVLQDEAQILRLRGSLVKWMADLFIGPHDDAHFARTERIGQVHVHVGLPARYMVSAMSVVRGELVEVLVRVGRNEHAASLALLLDVELAVMLDAYWEHYTTRTRDLSKVARLAATAGDPLGTRVQTAAAIEGVAALIVGLDAEGKIVLFNEEAERTTGYAADEILGRPVTMLFPREESEIVLAHLADSADETTPSSTFDSVLVTRVGRMRDVRARFKRMREAKPALATFLTATDVTEEIALAERTRQAERLAAIGRLAAGLAHEIRNPLNGAHLHLTLLERLLRKHGAGADDDALSSVKTVAVEVQRLSALVTEFLQFARPQPLTLRPTELSEVCAHAARVLGPEVEREGITLEVDLPVTPIHVRADRDKLSQVLINLMRNAMEAIANDAARPRSAPARGRVVLRVRRQPREVFVEIEDDGPGITDDAAPIFDAFYSTKPSGTGLGLPIAHRIVQDHGGSLGFESGVVTTAAGARPVGNVTIFRATLPVIDSPDEQGHS